MRLRPFRLADGTGVEPADGSNSKIGIFVDLSLAIEELHHAPKTAQFVVGLTLHVLVYDALNRYIQNI